ncbi:hypothetical protein [Pseudomonas sp. S2_C03]
MAGNSLEELKAWMRETSRTFGWDALVALQGHELNRVLLRDHIVRLSQGNGLGTHDLEIPIRDTPVVHYLSGVRLGAPQVSFANANLQVNRTQLHLPVVNASLMMVETIAEQKKVLRLARFDPLNAPHLTMELPVSSDKGKALLDLAEGREPLLQIFQTPEQQRQGGEQLHESLKVLGDDQRRFNVLALDEGDNSFLHAHSFDARAHKRPDSPATHAAPQAVDEDGALLLFAKLEEGSSGDYPGNDSGYRYLIPDAQGDEAFTATILLSQAFMHRTTFANAVLQLLDGGDFDRVNDSTGRLTGLVAKSGELEVPGTAYQSADYQFESTRYSVSAMDGAAPLTVELHDDHALQRWQCPITVTVSYRPIGGTVWATYTARFAVHLEHALRFYEEVSEAAGMEAELSLPYRGDDEITHLEGLPESIDPKVRVQILDFVLQTLKRALLVRFSQLLNVTAPDQLFDGMRVAGDSAFVPTHLAMPFDRAAFGRVHALGTSFSVVPAHAVAIAGRKMQLGVEPARPVQWAVENLSEDGSNPGTVSPTGEYQAPPAHTMQGRFNQVLIIATDPDSRERSVALVTVQTSAISLQLHFQACYHSERVELTAGHTGAEPLVWSIKDPVPGESGTLVKSDLPDGDHAYIAAPRVTGKAYVIDQIEVKNSATNDSESAWMLVIQHEPAATIKPVIDPGLPPGQVQLQAWVNGFQVDGQWSLPTGGPGTIDDSGLYTHDPQAREPFALITVLIEGGELGNFEGHIVLPLPLSDFTAVLEALAK